ncbi:hypothetical protein LCGC14_2371650 [marine sediment metagenome]|uniref:Uncharacterized protein n=1 Tax=marine sediment metagenome TaxID=412755 RepID=A0A0F9EYB3_9ZZZZ
MTFKLTIDTGNDAFGNKPYELHEEVARILMGVVARVRERGPTDGFALHDSNGNAVGRVEFTK